MKLLWTRNMSVGISHLDEDHKRLIRFVNELEMAIDAARESGVVDPIEIEVILHRMENYARQHFASEEAFMQSIDFPGLNMHRAAHQGFMVATEEMKRRYLGSTDPRTAQMIIKFLCAWITDHDYRMDSQYVDFLREQKDQFVAHH